MIKRLPPARTVYYLALTTLAIGCVAIVFGMLASATTKANNAPEYPKYTEVEILSGAADQQLLRTNFGGHAELFTPEFTYTIRATGRDNHASFITVSTFDAKTGEHGNRLSPREIALTRDEAATLAVQEGDTITVEFQGKTTHMAVKQTAGDTNFIARESDVFTPPQFAELASTALPPGVFATWIAPGHIAETTPLKELSVNYYGPHNYKSKTPQTPEKPDTQGAFWITLLTAAAVLGFILCIAPLMLPTLWLTARTLRSKALYAAAIAAVPALALGAIHAAWLVAIIPATILAAIIAQHVALLLRHHPRATFAYSTLSIFTLTSCAIAALWIAAVPYPAFAERAHRAFWVTPTTKPISEASFDATLKQLQHRFRTNGFANVYHTLDPVTLQEPLLYGDMPGEVIEQRYEPFTALKFNGRVVSGAYVYVADAISPEALDALFPDHYSDQQLYDATRALAAGKALTNQPAGQQEYVLITVEHEGAKTTHPIPTHALRSEKYPARAPAIIITPETASKLGLETYLAGTLLYRGEDFSLAQQWNLNQYERELNAEPAVHITQVGRDIGSVLLRPGPLAAAAILVMLVLGIAFAPTYPNRKWNIWAVGVGAGLGATCCTLAAIGVFYALGEPERISGIPLG